VQNVVMLNFVMSLWECRYAECRGALTAFVNASLGGMWYLTGDVTKGF
jgi:hypothetical protein